MNYVPNLIKKLICQTFFCLKGSFFLKILWIKKMLLILRGKSGSIVRFSCRLRLKGPSLHTCNRLRAVFLYIINLKPAITIYYNINVLNSLSSFCYLVFFIRFFAAIRTDAVLFLEATKQLGAMLNSCRSSLKNL